MNFRLHSLGQAFSGALAVTLAACGGGSGGGDRAGADSTTDPQSSQVTMTGHVVVDQAIRNTLVCLDLNANSACDGNEPTSARTGADGAYSLSYDSSAVSSAQAAGASLIAPIMPGAVGDATTAIDATDPSVAATSVPYVLKQVPGQAGQINPLTTLVAVGVASGMTEPTARKNLAAQLAIPEARIDNYQDEPAFDPARVRDDARTLAKVTARALEHGATLQVLDQQAQINASPGELASLRFTDAGNHFFRTFDNQAKVSGVIGGVLRDSRGGATAGVATAHHVLYPQAHLTPSGWVRCDQDALFTHTRGSPNRSTFCHVSNTVSYRLPSEDISGRTMASVVTAMAADPASNTINNGLAVDPLVAALGAATFPAGSVLTPRRSFSLNQPIFINNLNTDGGPGTLEQMIAFRQASSVTPPSVGRSLSLGLGSGNSKNLRVAFTGTTTPTTGTVQFYECDLNAAQTVASNCAATQTGTYAISEVHGVRVMRYAGHLKTVMNHTRVHVEVKNTPSIASGDMVFVARELKPTLSANTSSSKRLNATAWAAMKQQLGL